MDQGLYQSVANSTAHRPIRDIHAALVFENPLLLDDLMDFALNVTDKNHHKACWILELVIEQRFDWLTAFLDRFCDALPKFKHDGAVRSIAKICQLAAMHQSKKGDFLTKGQLKKITETCFDWLIGDAKVATKAYAMRALWETGKQQSWVHRELKVVLEMGYATHSAAYQAAAKEILKK